MAKYCANCLLVHGKKKYLPGAMVEMDEAVALPLVVQEMLIPVVEKNDNGKKAPTESTPASPDGLAAAVEAAKAKVAAAEQALDKAEPKQRGARSSALKKAQEALAAAEEQLNAATAE